MSTLAEVEELAKGGVERVTKDGRRPSAAFFCISPTTTVLAGLDESGFSTPGALDGLIQTALIPMIQQQRATCAALVVGVKAHNLPSGLGWQVVSGGERDAVGLLAVDAHGQRLSVYCDPGPEWYSVGSIGTAGVVLSRALRSLLN